MITIDELPDSPTTSLKIRGKTVAIRMITDAQEAEVRAAFDVPKANLILDPHAPVDRPRTIEDKGDGLYVKAVRELGHNISAAEAAIAIDLCVGGKGWSSVGEQKNDERRAWLRSAAAELRGRLSSDEIMAILAAMAKLSEPALLEARAKKNSSDVSAGS